MKMHFLRVSKQAIFCCAIIPVGLSAAGQTFNFGADVLLGDSQTALVSSTSARQDQAFTAPYNMSIDTVNFQVNPLSANHASGTFLIMGDDGTANHYPNGVVLGSSNLFTMNGSSDTLRSVKLNSPLALAAGSIYHLVCASPNATGGSFIGLRVLNDASPPASRINTIGPAGEPAGYYNRGSSSDSGTSWNNDANTTTCWVLSNSTTGQAFGQPYNGMQTPRFGKNLSTGSVAWAGQQFRYNPAGGDATTGSLNSLAIQLLHDPGQEGALTDDIRVHVVTVASQAYVTNEGVTTLRSVPGRELYSGVLVPAGTALSLDYSDSLYSVNIPTESQPTLIKDQKYMILIETNSDIGLSQFLVSQGLVNGSGTGTLGWGSAAINANFGGVTDGFAVLTNAVIGKNGLPGYMASQDQGGTDPTLFRDTRFNVNVSSGPRWKLDGNGDWADANNWFNAVPNGAGSIANLSGAISASRTITNSTTRTIGHLVFDSNSAYTVGGNATLTLNTLANTNNNKPSIDVVKGSHTISSPLALGSDTHITVIGGSALNITKLADTSTSALFKYGQGTLVVNRVRTKGLDISSGTVAIAAGRSASATSSVATLSVDGTGVLDLNDQDMVITAQTGSQPTVRSMLVSGYNAGSWNGSGIGSSLAAAASASAHPTAIGHASAAQVFGGTGGVFSGISVNPTDVLLRYTYSGDANLDGKVNTLDFNQLASGFGQQSTAVWFNGDFNYDGNIDSLDFAAFVNNYGLIAPAAGNAALGAYVPEPSSIAVAMLCGLSLASPRRRIRATSKQA